MNKNKRRIDIFIILMILLFVSSSIISREIGNLDEIWNYNVSNNYANGLVPYRDYNTIVTPLLQILAGIVLKIFLNELITMRILAVFLISGIMFLIYKILDILRVNKSIIILSIVGILFLEYQYFCIDYNFFALFLTLIIMFLEIKHLLMQTKSNQEYKYNLLIGILAGLVLMTKQTIGLFVSITVVGYMIINLLIDKIKYENNIKYELKNIIFRMLGIAIPVLFFIIYLLYTNSLNYFLDYAINGIKTFSNKIEYINLFESKNVLIRILAVLVPLSFIINFVISIIKKDKRIFVVNCLSIAMFVVVFPISDDIHFIIGATTSFIAIIYNINNILREIISKNKNRKKLFLKYFIEGISQCLIVFVFISGIYINVKNIRNVEYYSKLQHYKYIPISKDYEREIMEVEEYIKKSDKKVYILNYDAAIYMIPIDIYNKDYDMFLKGNIGSKGEEGKIEKIKKENARYLIVREGISRNWQNPEMVRKYIQNNMKYIETISNFDVYENYHKE